MRLSVIFIAALSLSCTRGGSTPTPTTAPTFNDRADFERVASGLNDFESPSGWIVSLRDGKPVNQGDSLIFSGIAMASLPCDQGEPIAVAMMDMLSEMDGGVYRHPTLKDAKPSLDGLLGLWAGIHHRVADCAERNLWAAALSNHRSWTVASGLVTPGFDLARDQLLYELGLQGQPDPSRGAVLDLEAGAWSTAVLEDRDACYRLNLSLLALQISGAPHSEFCLAAAHAGIPLIDQFCGQPGLEAWLRSFRPDVYQYRHQDCPAWQPPDSGTDHQPGVDYLAGWTSFFGTP